MMPVETAAAGTAVRRLRVDTSKPVFSLERFRRSVAPALAVLAGLLVVWGVESRDLGPEEAELGLAAGSPVGPLGQVYGGWMTGLLPGRVLPSQLYVWVFCEGGLPNEASVQWPTVGALLAMGWVVSYRVRRTLGGVAGVLTALALFGSVALIDHSAALGFDAMTGLWVVAALDRVLGKGSDWKAGLWAGLAVFAGGWPALLAIVLPLMVVGRRGSYLSARLLVPPVVAFLGWTAWMIGSGVPGEVWGEAIVRPLRSGTNWGYAGVILAAGLPWSPFAGLMAWRSVRQGLSEESRRLVLGWLQTAGACALAGTLIPGLGPVAWLPTLVGLAVSAAAGIAMVVSGRAGRGARWSLLLGSLVVGVAWAVLEIVGGTYVAAAAPYYRYQAAPLAALGIVTVAFSVVGTFERRCWWAVGVLVATAIGLKVAHAGIVVPEWNYRVGPGMAGRAIGQWVPPRSSIYTTHHWPYELMFATGHPIRQLASPRLLEYELGEMPTYVLLLESEFENWPAKAPRIQKVHRFESASGQIRVLARTEGDLMARPQAHLSEE